MKRLNALVGLLLLSAAMTANAAVSDAEFQQMKEMLENALERISELEQQEAVVDNVQRAEIGVLADAEIATAEQVAANTAKLDKMSWAERITLKGDFRYRYQPEEASGLLDADNQPESDVSRNRQRIRARAALIAQASDSVEVGFGLATGGDNPVSANQTLGGAGAKKEINLDLAYFDWNFAQGAYVHGGKFENEFVDVAGAGMLWDSDWRPEGFDLRYANDLLYVTALGTWLSEDLSNGSGSSFNYGGQVGFTPEVGIAKFDTGVGYWMIKSEGRNCYDDDGGANDNDCFGNTQVDGTGTVNNTGDQFYLMDYAPVELYGNVSFGTSLAFGLFADYAKNLDAKAIVGGPSAGQKLDTAYVAGAYVGAAKKKGEWQLKAYYQDKEADSVLGILSDSDFGGGGSDSKGYVFKGKFMLSNSTYLQASWLAAERQDSNGYENGDPTTSNPYDVDTLQLDLQFKYK